MDKSCGGAVGASSRNTRADLLWLLAEREADVTLQGQQPVWESYGSGVWGSGTGGDVAGGGMAVGLCVMVMGLRKLWGTGALLGAAQEPARVRGQHWVLLARMAVCLAGTSLLVCFRCHGAGNTARISLSIAMVPLISAFQIVLEQELLSTC